MIGTLWLALTVAQAATPDPIEVSPDLRWTTGKGGDVPAQSWWVGFGDPDLSAAIEESLGANGDLAAAADRVRIASGTTRMAFAPLLPQASFEIGANTAGYDGSLCASIASSSQLSAAFGALATDPAAVFADPAAFFGAPTANQDLCTTASALLVAGWQIDLFGRQTLAWQASLHDLQASEGDRDAQRMALITFLAESWYDVVASNAQVAALEDQLAAQTALLDLIELRYREGGAGGLDVLQQRQQVASTRALLPTARAGREARRRQLAALLGRDPSNLPTLGAELPLPSALPPAGTPQELVARRPDLAAAWERTRGARDARASAQLALLPTLRLSANTGWTGYWVDGLQTGPTWGAGASLSIPLFGGGLTHGRIRQARGAEAMAIDTYNQAVLGAIAEVDGALVRDEEARARLEAVTAQSDAANAAYDASRERYLAGLDSYLAVLAAQGARQAAALALISARRDAVSARIQLHDALGQLDRRP